MTMPSQAALRRVLNYDPLPGLLYWRTREDASASWNTRYAGRAAGSPHNMGYLSVRLAGRLYLAHRLVWKWLHGAEPNLVDHINGDRSDNRPQNLRSCNPQQNAWNTKARGSCGVKGVRWHPRAQRYQARICTRDREFSLGYFDDVDAAGEAYRKAAIALRGEEFARSA